MILPHRPGVAEVKDDARQIRRCTSTTGQHHTGPEFAEAHETRRFLADAHCPCERSRAGNAPRGEEQRAAGQNPLHHLSGTTRHIGPSCAIAMRPRAMVPELRQPHGRFRSRISPYFSGHNLATAQRVTVTSDRSCRRLRYFGCVRRHRSYWRRSSNNGFSPPRSTRTDRLSHGAFSVPASVMPMFSVA